jgi:hypothetical protein
MPSSVWHVMQPLVWAHEAPEKQKSTKKVPHNIEVAILAIVYPYKRLRKRGTDVK